MLLFKTLHNKLKTISLVIVISLISFESLTAATKYWIGTGANSNWGTSTNWSNSSGGATCNCVPAATDIAIFDGGGNNACTINTSITIGTLTITSGYTNTITQSNTFSIGTGGASLSGGTFAGYTGSGSFNMTCAGNFTISGTAFTSTKSSFTVGGSFTLSSGSFTHNSGTVVFATTKTITGSTTFYDLTFTTPSIGAATHTISSGTVLTVNNTLVLSTTNALTINTGDIEAKGDITINNTASGGGGSALIKINGTGTQTLTGSGVANAGNLCKIEVDKSSGTLNLASIISIANDWTYTTGTVSSGTSTVDACASLNMDCQGSGGTMSFYNLTTYTGTTTLTGDVGISNNLTINNSTTLSASSYGIYLSGQWTDNGTFTYSTSTVQLQGTALQTINTSSSTETFYNLIVNKTTGRVLLNDPLIINHAVTFTEGIIKASSSNYFKLIDNATAGAGNDSSFVYGYYKKVGDDAFTFALGDTSVSTGGYHPLSIGAPSSATDAYTAQYFNSGTSFSPTRDSILNYTSTCEYWNLARDVGSSNVTVKLGWNTTSCNIDSLADLRVAYWNGSKWKDKGGSYTGNTTIGDVVTSSAQSSFGYFIIAKKYPDANAGADVTICNGASTNLVGSLGGTSYAWSPTTGLSCTTCYNPTATPTSTITYTYTVTYPSGYPSSDNVTVTVNATPTASAGSDKTILYSKSVTIGGSPSASGGTSPYTYSWTPSTGLSSTTVANPVSTTSSTITYVLLVTDVNGCTKRDTMIVTVNPSHYVNTISLDSLLWSADTLKYTLNGAGISGKYLAGTNRSFNASLPTDASKITMKLNFLSLDTLIDTLFIIYDIDSSATISNASVLQRRPDNLAIKDTFELDSTFYAISTDTITFFKKIINSYFINKYKEDYGGVSEKLDAGWFDASKGWLSFIYEEKTAETPYYMTFRIYDDDNVRIASDSTSNIKIPVKQSYNMYNLDLYTLNVRTSGYYIMEIISMNNEKYYLRFKL